MDRRATVIGFVILAAFALGAGAGFRSFEIAYRSASDARAAALSREVAASIAYVARLREAPEPVTLLFGGDVMLARSVAKQIALSGDERFPFLLLASTTLPADIAFANAEGTISSRGKNQGSIYSFRADPSVVAGLSLAGFDVLSLANNHIWDWGGDALSDTREHLNTAGIATVGAGPDEVSANAPAILEAKGVRFGFLAYTTLYPASLEAEGENPGISSFSLEKAGAAIAGLKQEVDVVIVSMHWGEEYRTNSTQEQRDTAHALADLGADFVIGHHPHVTEEVETYHSPVTDRDSVIAYSLGNLVFDQYFSEETMSSFLLEVVIKGKAITSIKQIPIRLNASYQPYPVL